MFKNIPKPILTRMQYLEEIDQQDRLGGTSRLLRLRQIPPETGRFIALMAVMAPKGNFVEIGTSAGYSTLWLSLACKELKTLINTFEILEEKQKLAAETFQQAKVESFVNLVKGDALSYLNEFKNISFCFLDCEKEIYQACYDLIIPKMKQGGILIADNAINHERTLKRMLDNSLKDNRVDSMVVNIGKGLLLCRKC